MKRDPAQTQADLEERLAWFPERVDATQCELIAIMLRSAFVLAVSAHGMSCGVRVQSGVKAGINIGHAVFCVLELRDDATRARAQDLAAQIGAFVSLTLECHGKPGP